MSLSMSVAIGILRVVPVEFYVELGRVSKLYAFKRDCRSFCGAKAQSSSNQLDWPQYWDCSPRAGQ